MSNRDRIANIEYVLATLIAWMAQSANSPIRMEEARELLRKLGEEGRP